MNTELAERDELVLQFCSASMFLAEEEEEEEEEEEARTVVSLMDITERKCAEKALVESENKFRWLYEYAPIAYHILTPYGIIMDVNHRWCQVMDYSREEVLGKEIFDFVVEEERKAARASFMNKKAGKQTFVEGSERNYLTKAGAVKTFKNYDFIVVDQSQNITSVQTTLVDITERKRSEQLITALNQAAINMSTAISPEVIFTSVAKELKKLNFSCFLFPIDHSNNKLLTKYLSFESKVINVAEKLTGMKHEDFSFPIDSVDVYRKIILEKKAIFDNDAIEIIRQVLPKSLQKITASIAKIIPFQYIIAPLNVENNVTGLFSVLSNDLTAEDVPTITAFSNQLAAAWKKAELLQSLRESEIRYRGLFEDSPVSLWEEDFSAVKQRLDALRAGGVTDMRAYLESHPQEVADCIALVRVLDVNKAALKLYRARSKEDLLNNLASIVSVESQGYFINELAGIAEGQAQFSFVGTDKTLNGEKIEIIVYGAYAPSHESDLSKVIVSTVDITARVRAERLLNALNQASVAMGTASTQQEIFNVVSEQLKQLDITCILFPIDQSQSKLLLKYVSFELAVLNVAEKLSGLKLKGFSIPIDTVDAFREVVREKKTLFISDSEQVIQQVLPKGVKKFSSQIRNMLGTQKIIYSPLLIDDRAIGMFSVQSNNLIRDDIPIVTAFADQLAGAWNKVELLQNLKKTVEGTIRTIAKTVEARDPYTSGHQIRVADLAAAIASEMHLSEQQVEGIKMTGIIHDLGKIQVPAEILSKPGKITDLEYEIIKTHSQVGFDLLKDIEFPWPIAEMVLQHHEKMDGSGYPQGLKGEEILLESRILAVSDVVEAMASHRPYRPALGIKKALDQIRGDRGTLLDPDVVDACLKVFKAGYEFPKN